MFEAVLNAILPRLLRRRIFGYDWGIRATSGTGGVDEGGSERSGEALPKRRAAGEENLLTIRVHFKGKPMVRL